jgi:hypothetical protein
MAIVQKHKILASKSPMVAGMAGLMLLFWVRPVITHAGPSEQVVVNAGDDLQNLVAKHASGTHFKLRAGIYRLQSITPKDGDSFTGEAGAVLNGSQLLTTFAREGAYYVASLLARQQSTYRGTCDADRLACIYPEDLFIDDSPLQRVSALSEVGTGKWYLDYSAGKAYLTTNPKGHTVEISIVAHAFMSSAVNVTIEGLSIEKYACVAGDGAIQAKYGSSVAHNWVVRNSDIRLNHGVGIWVGHGMKVLDNKVHDNGQMGIAGTGSDVVIEGNEIAFNNYAGYHYGWEAGGTKFVFTKNLVVRNNFAHDNLGPGLWTDIENIGTLYENNRTRNNKGAGIQHEVSYQALIRSNIIQDDGFTGDVRRMSPWYGAGIVIAGSSDVEVYGNTVTNCMNGIVGRYPRREFSRSGTPYKLRNLFVHDNNITQQNGGVAAGIVREGTLDDEVFTSWNNRFRNNHFVLADQSAKAFAWRNAVETVTSWEREFNKK